MAGNRPEQIDVEAPEKMPMSTVSQDKETLKTADDALRFMRENETVGASPEENAKLLRKIDLFLTPILLVTYTLSFMDKQAMSYSANFGLLKDMNLTTNQYSWASGSIVNIVLMVCHFFVPRLLQIFPIGRMLAWTVVAWAIVLLCTTPVRSFAAIMTTRALLGVAESVIAPAIVIITAQWYTRDEQPARTGYWFFGNAIAQIFGGLIGFGIGHIHYEGVGNWIWYVVLFGAITLLWGIAMIFLLPNSPMDVKFLTQRERVMAVERVRANRTGIVNRVWKWDQFFESLRDPMTWMLFASMLLSAIPSGGVASFGNIVIKGFNFTALNTTLMQMPLGVVQGCSILFTGYLTSKFPNTRCFFLGVTQIPPLVGSILLVTLPSSNKWGRLGSYYTIQTHTVAYVMGYALYTANTSGFTKKATTGAILFTAGSIGQISGPQLFKGNEAPRYRTAFVAAICCFALHIVLSVMMYGYLKWENDRRDRKCAAHGDGRDRSDDDEDEGLKDLTDFEQKHFRYVY